MIMKLLLLSFVLSSSNAFLTTPQTTCATTTTSVGLDTSRRSSNNVDFGGVNDRSLLGGISYAPLPSVNKGSSSSRGSKRSSRLFLFGGVFGGNDKEGEEEGELAVYSKLGTSSGAGDNVQYEGLSDYIQKWSKLFETDPKGMKLTTPVQIIPSISSSGGGDDVAESSGVQFVFKSTNTGYMSRQEEDSVGGGYKRPPTSNSDETSSVVAEKKANKDEKKEGGVEVLVERLTSGEVRVRAQRCNMDENTMIKEMSEEQIIKELKRAIDSWKTK